MQHLDEGTIHAWLDGALPASEANDVERHTAQCGECAAMVAEARGMIAGASRIVSSLDIVRGGVIPQSKRAPAVAGSLWRSLRLTPARAALAATVMIAVSTLLTVRHDTVDKVVPVAFDTTVASRSDAPAASPTAVAPAAPNVVGQVGGAPQRASKAEGTASTRNEVAEPRPRGLERRSASSTPAADATTETNPAARRVAVAPPSAPAPVSGSGAADTARSRLAKTFFDSAAAANRAAAGAAASAPRRLGQEKATVQLRDVITTSSVQLSEPPGGCFQITRDSSVKLGSLPERFALVQVRADTVQNLVRAVTADGRPDSLIAGASWTQLSPSVINVRFGPAVRAPSLAMRFDAGSALGSANESGDGSARTFAVTRASCRP